MAEPAPIGPANRQPRHHAARPGHHQSGRCWIAPIQRLAEAQGRNPIREPSASGPALAADEPSAHRTCQLFRTGLTPGSRVARRPASGFSPRPIPQPGSDSLLGLAFSQAQGSLVGLAFSQAQGSLVGLAFSQASCGRGSVPYSQSS